MAENPLKYTNLTYQEIVDAVNSRLAADSNFNNFRESAVAQTLVEIFAACVDIMNYYIERRAEESFIDTAKLKSSIILLAKQLGYVVSRPIPAEATIKLKLSGDLTGYSIQGGDILQIPAQTSFTYDNMDFVLKETFNYTFTSADAEDINVSAVDYEKTISLDDNDSSITIVQGEIKSKTIEGSTNQQAGQKFQIYKIDDPTFSNRYGSEDFDTAVTNVYVGNAKTDGTKYIIDRRSLINWESIESFVRGTASSVCVLRTSPDESVELLFGDAQYAALGATVSATGAQTTYDDIYIDYLSTKGAEANRTGVIDESLTTSTTVRLNGDASKDITDETEFLFNTNIVGGADMETIESIKLNAPNIYYSLDRLVTAKDYVYYLKSLTSPIDIRNAIAWGEQEEMDGTTGEPISKLFNIVFFSCLVSLYNLDGTNYSPRTKNSGIENTVLDLDFDEDEAAKQNYFDIYTKQNVVEQLKKYDVTGHYFTVYGDAVNQSSDDIAISYDGYPLAITYSSESYVSAVQDTHITSAVSLSATNSHDDIATQIDAALVGFTDLRGNSATNSNYGSTAFADIDCYWDTVNSRYIISGGRNDSCYIMSFSSTGFSDAIGVGAVNSESVSYTDSNSIISTKITNVVDKLDSRSQVTVRNIYISPIIQKFKLTGNIYVKQLADRNAIHRDIKNEVYEWLDSNADFGNSIYLSNIVEIIESYPNVVNADVEFEPSVPSLSASQTTFFDPTWDDRIQKNIYAVERANIYAVIQEEIANYIGEHTTASTTDIKTIWSTLNSGYTVKSETLSWYKNINERTFYNGLVKNIYDNLQASTSTRTAFRDSQDFLDVVSDIHKDLLYVIRYNMLDSKGNIAREDTTQLVNGVEESSYYRGGTSLGNEIVQVDLQTNCIYRTA